MYSILSIDGVNDEIMISGGNFISGNESRSISVWADGFYGNIVSLGHGWTSNARFSILINQRRVYIIGQWNDWATNYYLPENQMTHLVVTHDGNTLKLYADGVLQRRRALLGVVATALDTRVANHLACAPGSVHGTTHFKELHGRSLQRWLAATPSCSSHRSGRRSRHTA